MQNFTLKPASTGEVALFKSFNGHKVAGIYGRSSKGTGWRPVCGGSYVGSKVCPTEILAIKWGVEFIRDLGERVDLANRKLPLLLAKKNEPQQVQPTANDKKPFKRSRAQRKAVKND